MRNETDTIEKIIKLSKKFIDYYENEYKLKNSPSFDKEKLKSEMKRNIKRTIEKRFNEIDFLTKDEIMFLLKNGFVISDNEDLEEIDLQTEIPFCLIDPDVKKLL